MVDTDVVRIPTLATLALVATVALVTPAAADRPAPSSDGAVSIDVDPARTPAVIIRGGTRGTDVTVSSPPASTWSRIVRLLVLGTPPTATVTVSATADASSCTINVSGGRHVSIGNVSCGKPRPPRRRPR